MIFRILVFSICGLLFLNCSANNKSKIQPNIIYIHADDLSCQDLSCYVQTPFSTPSLDVLAESGIRFTQTYPEAPEFNPSRGTLMTGMHTGHAPIRINSSVHSQEFIPDSLISVAEVLKEAAYSTGFVGKWRMGLLGSEGVPEKQGFDFTFGFYDQGRGHPFFLLY